ncbi:hypothetical protein OIU77_018545 [Salix suchowensis]|uniref:LRAT domain-containing protein n=1 Tax=Salix suchowensis TaxID=1278906 RepID=A0ABQ9CCT2_9ROSI|nr:hypothetical protein OIU77_018545 [Salix suchowensis]
MSDNKFIDAVLDTMRSLNFKAIDVKELKRGDHIFYVSKPGFYSHHGIYVGNDRVIHFMPAKKTNAGAPLRACKNCGYKRKDHLEVVRTCLDCFHTKGFLSGSRLYLYRYGLPRSECEIHRINCTHMQSYSADQVVARAEEIFESEKQFGKYNFILNNCEYFATYCKCGDAISTQVEQGVDYVLRLIQRTVHQYQQLKNRDFCSSSR